MHISTLNFQITVIWCIFSVIYCMSLVCKTVKESIRSFKSVVIKCGKLLLNLDSSRAELYQFFCLCHHLATDISKGDQSFFIIDLTYRQTHSIIDLIYRQNLGSKILCFFIKLIVALQGNNIPTEMSYSAALALAFEFFLQIQCWVGMRKLISLVEFGKRITEKERRKLMTHTDQHP